MSLPLILAIDTSCDETCAAVTCGQKVFSNVVASQINIHQKYGGVVPHLAKRAHEAKIEFVVKEALRRIKTRRTNFRSATALPRNMARVSTGKFGAPSQFINAIAVTIGPGLAPALEVGLAFAKKLARQWQKPLIAVNHMEGHLLSSLSLPNFRVDQAERRAPGAEAASGAIEHVACLLVEQKFPWIALLASGGHTELVLVKKIGSYQLLGQTLDDAAGEALDKLAKMLQLGYPGGPIIEELAKQGNPNSIPLPVPMQRSQDLNFSFSGLKTAAMYLIKKSRLSKQFTQDLSAAFQQAIAVSLTTKLKKAIRQYQPRAILLGGGVFSNLYLRRQVRLAAKPLPVYLPYSKKLFTDNAAMIGVAAYHHFLEKDFANPEKLDRQPNLNF